MKNMCFFFLFIFFSVFVSAVPSGWIDVKKYGASGNKTELASPFIQKALDACAAKGGGTVYLPPGDYLCGTLVIPSNTTLWLEAGATIYGSRNAGDYLQNDFKEGITGFEQSSSSPILIYADGVKNIAMRGKGTIDAQAEREYLPLKQVDGFIARETELARKAGIEMKQYYKIDPTVCMVFIINSKNILIEDITMRESVGWTLHLQWSDNIDIRGCYIYSDLNTGVNADGIDLDGCTNVRVSDCLIQTGDDAIVLKTTLFKGKTYPCENITVTNCILTSTSTALKLGTESHGDFRYITFSNCIIRNTNRALSIVVRDGANVEYVNFSDIRLETNRKHFNWWGNGDPIWLVIKKRNENSRIGTINNIHFQNIRGVGQGTSVIEGFSPEYPIGRITFSNVRLDVEPEHLPDKRTTHAFWAKNIEKLEMNNVEFAWKAAATEKNWQNLYCFEDIDELELFRVKGANLPDNPHSVVELQNIGKKNIENSNVLK